MRQKTQKDLELEAIIRPLTDRPVWHADYPLHRIPHGIEELGEQFGGLEMSPDYQRGHVWSPEQQVKFIEAIMRHTLPADGLTFQFNLPNFSDHNYKGDLPRRLQCLDGLQRITALSKFMAGEIEAFGHPVGYYDDTEFTFRTFFKEVQDRDL